LVGEGDDDAAAREADRVIDYRRFIGRTEERVLAYLDGDAVVDADRGLRLAAVVAPGWWRFTVSGRTATAVERVDAPEDVLGRLEAAVGHWTGTHLVHGSGAVELLHLRPEDELPRFAPCRGRRWYSGDLVFERLDLEGEAEETVRRTFEDRHALGTSKGIPGTLRAAYALAVVAEASTRAGIPAAPIEVRAELTEVADQGWPAADRVLARLRAERLAEAARVRGLGVRAERPASHVPSALGDAAERAAAALIGSGAQLLEARTLAGGLLAVTYRFLGERLHAVVEAESLRVVDAGICVSGHDEELGLASLPSVVREGVEEGMLVITRHG
jgi:hypothetical protein